MGENGTIQQCKYAQPVSTVLSPGILVGLSELPWLGNVARCE